MSRYTLTDLYAALKRNTDPIARSLIEAKIRQLEGVKKNLTRYTSKERVEKRREAQRRYYLKKKQEEA